MTIVNTRIPVEKLKIGDHFVAVHNLPSEGSSYAVVAEVSDIVGPFRAFDSGKLEYVIQYTACDDPSEMRYGADVTVAKGQKVTKVVAA